MHQERFAIAAIEPGDDDEAVAGGDAPKRAAKLLGDFEPRVGRTFLALKRRFAQIAKRRADDANRSQLDHAVCSNPMVLPEPSATLAINRPPPTSVTSCFFSAPASTSDFNAVRISLTFQ